MTLHYTPNFQLAYLDADTSLDQLAAASLDLATKTDAALTRGGVAPPAASDLVTLSGRVTTLEGQLPAAGSNDWTAFTVAADGGALWRCASSAPAVGNGTLVARYIKRGKQVTFRISLLFGSTTSGGTGGWTFGLPFAAVAGLGEQVLTGKGFCAATPVGDFTAHATIAAAASVCTPFATTGTSSFTSVVRNATAGGAVGTGIPTVAGAFTFGNGHNFVIGGTYESAA